MKTRESRLLMLFCSIQLLVLVLLLILTWHWGWSVLAMLTLLFALLYPFGWLTYKFWQQLNLPLMLLSNYVQRLHSGEDAVCPNQLQQSGLLAQLSKDIDNLAADRLRAEHQQQSLALLIELMFSNWSQPVCVFSGQGTLLYANPASNSLPGIARLVGSSYTDLGFEMTPAGLSHHLLHKGWQTQSIRYEWQGEQYWLFTAFDISQPLQQAELAIQTNLVRVLSHELRNSLTPMSSMADTLLCGDNWQESQVRKVLERVRQRANVLLEFVQRFASVSQLPPPRQEWFSFSAVLEQCNGLLKAGDQLEFSGEGRCYADPELFAQMLINLVKNALEASEEGERKVWVRCYCRDKSQVLQVDDCGAGFANLDNALTPLYTTKTGGSGIGLTLANVIISKHGGRIHLGNLPGGGARVELVWPLP
ncbi:hypothetical protein GCM10009092_24090 [Bowmanella denitrificans]|uniref:histidine kinase n=1 Tax=Bowmanella denitrificans TaxID=366582 RepID=A0ABN0XA62_9ALTE|nr:HAMP domain-containing sensor histidine kinase [Bowmanella denitrificans]